VASYSFVDDTKLGSAATEFETIQHAIDNLKKTIDMWQGRLKTTGGELVREKSFWYLIDPGEDETPCDLDTRITMEDNAGNVRPIKRLHNYAA